MVNPYIRVLAERDEAFELKLEANKWDNLLSGVLRSPQLDPTMNRGNELMVYVESIITGARRAPRFTLDAFQCSSLQDYLQRQALLRSRFETELLHNAKQVNVECSADELWNRVRIVKLVLPKRSILTTEHRRALEGLLSGAALDAELAVHDLGEASVGYSVAFARDWDDETGLDFHIRNDAICVRVR